MIISRRTIREYAESLAVAFVLAMVIRHFVVEAFRIPTSSMEPTLIGNQSHGDRILVSKFQYDLHPPQAWDVVVFKIDEARIDYYKRYYGLLGSPIPDYFERHFNVDRGGIPPDTTRAENGTVKHAGSPEHVNYVKRLVGLPGQTIQVINGDVFINGTIARKPRDVENNLLVLVTSDGLLESNRPGQTFFENWSKVGDGAVSTAKDGSIKFDGSGTECGVRYLLPIEDRIRSSSGGARQGSLNAVGDVRLDGDLVLQHLERREDPRQGDPLHVRAQGARPDELDLGMRHGNVVAHRALGDHHDLRGTRRVHMPDHPGRRAHVIGLRQHVRRTLGMRQDLDARIARAIVAQILSAETLVHLAVPLPQNDFHRRAAGDVPAQELVRQEDDPVRAERLHDLDRVGRGAADVRLGFDGG